MASYTDYLKLRITNMNTDGDDFFDFETDLNQNFKKIDTYVKAKSNNYNVFCVNTGVIDDNGNPAFLNLDGNVLKTVGTFDITNANGKTYTITDVLQTNISSLTVGKYNLFINPVTKTITALNNNIFVDSKMPADAAAGDYLLNISKVPFSLDKKTSTGIETNLNEVFAGTLEIASGGGGE